MAARSSGAEVTGFDPDNSVLEGALENVARWGARPGSVKDAVGGGSDAAGPLDAVFACAPVGGVPALVDEASGGGQAEDTIVTDVGSTKRNIAGRVSDERLIGGRPIAGIGGSSVVEARRAPTCSRAPPGTSPRAGRLERRPVRAPLTGLLVSLGARPVDPRAETRGTVFSHVSHPPHVLANVLVSQAARTVDPEDESLPRVGPSFRDATRVAGANSGIWTDIYMQNAAAIADEVDATIPRLTDVAAPSAQATPEAVRAWNDRARDDRRRLLEGDIAGGPVHELRVTVDNRPGVVAELAVALGRGGVNIVDMRLAPAPDNLTGAITFWVAGDESARRAAQLMAGLGFPVMEQG